jgi:biopolymer transport protein ExbD
MGRQKRRSQLKVIDEINMTPLIDLTFLLLIIFMVTAPLMENGVNVSPPKLEAEQLPEDNNKTVTLNKFGEIVYEKNTVSKDELIQLLNQIFSQNKKTNLFVRADGNQPYKKVIALMKTIKDAGFTNVFLITVSEG